MAFGTEQKSHRIVERMRFTATMLAQFAGAALLRRKYVGAIIGSAAVLLVGNAAAEDELWSRALMGTPSSGPFRPFNVVIIESVAGNHLLATCDYTNYSNEMGRARMVRIQGIQKGGKFHPRVFAKVANDVSGEWVQIAELGNIGHTASRKVAPNAVANDIIVELDVFRPWIDKFIYGALVLPTGEKAVFDLKDLLSPEREAAALPLSERRVLSRKAERGDADAALALALYYKAVAPNLKSRQYFLSLASRSGSRASIEALADFYSMPGGMFRIQRAVALRKDLKRRFPKDVDNIDWAERCAFEYREVTGPAARKNELIFLNLAASWRSIRAKQMLQSVSVADSPRSESVVFNSGSEPQVVYNRRDIQLSSTEQKIVGAWSWTYIEGVGRIIFTRDHKVRIGFPPSLKDGRQIADDEFDIVQSGIWRLEGEALVTEIDNAPLIKIIERLDPSNLPTLEKKVERRRIVKIDNDQIVFDDGSSFKRVPR